MVLRVIAGTTPRFEHAFNTVHHRLHSGSLPSSQSAEFRLADRQFRFSLSRDLLGLKRDA